MSTIKKINILKKIDLLKKIEEAKIKHKAGNSLEANHIFQVLLKSNNDSFDLASISVGYETQESGGADSDGYFVGLTFPEVGAGSVNVAAATTGLVAEGADEKMIYEASYSYSLNDGMTVTPGIFIKEVDGSDDQTGVAVKTSFSF